MARRTPSRPGQPTALACFVTSHGFGHLNRAVAVINRIPESIEVFIRSHANLFPHWHERLTRPAVLEEHVSDAGAVNPPGDSNATDGPATLELAARVHARAMAAVEDDAAWLSERKIAAVFCDAPPVPLVAASQAGIPGFLLANFTWADIYAPYARTVGPEARALVADLRRAYRQATAVFRAEPGLKMAWLPGQIEAGLVSNPGRNRRGELRRLLGLGGKERLVYFYVGRYGQADLGWAQLERLEARGVHLVGFHPAPPGPWKNLHVVSASEWSGGDLIASTDALVAKAGYGTAAEAMNLGKPIIYPPRWGFAEFRALDRSLRSWGGGIPISTRDFYGLRLEAALERAFALGPLSPPFPRDGAARIADHLARVCLGRPEAERQNLGSTKRKARQA